MNTAYQDNSAAEPRRERRNQQGRTRNRGASGKKRQYSSQAPSRRNRTADPARLTAYQVVRAVSADDAYANLVLPQYIRRNRLNKRDAGFATELTYGSLRWQGSYDAILAECVDRELDKLDPEVLDVLRLGTHQLMHMRVPTHAALDSTVALVRDQIGAGPSGLVNAVLRKVSHATFDEWLEKLAPGDSDDDLAIWYGHPRWIVRALKQALVTHGRSAGELVQLLEADNLAPDVNLVALPGIGDLQPVLDHGAEPSSWAPDAATFSGGDAGKIPGVATGAVRIQDVGSQLAARALVQVAPVGECERWLDMCAGPGGKAALLAAEAQRAGAHLVANEVSEHRSRLVGQALAPVEGSVWELVTYDGRELTVGLAQHGAPETFDRIMLDAPCTGLGALRRRPESRWRRTTQDLAVLSQLQRQLADAAVELLAPGGYLGYVTCSPHQVETQLQVQDLLQRHPELRLVDTPAAVLRAATDRLERTSLTPSAEGQPATAQLWPHLHHTDAMFIAVMAKTDGSR